MDRDSLAGRAWKLSGISMWKFLGLWSGISTGSPWNSKAGGKNRALKQ